MNRRSSKVALSATFLALAAAVGTTIAGCSSTQDTAYCGDEQRTILPAEECEDDDGGAFIYVGSYGGSTYRTGDRLPSGGQKVAAGNSSGRSNLGLPARGGFGGNGAKVSSGG
ncbi:hypothetical protein [Micromonospora maritima]|uniref:hypothetical protein n=1 Tax=Micromonospora maritima TaxID=986711 RepID=UPI00157D0BAD|nr:hypothetical protein [Micromonospora maritima]